jgi:hypothetical protein
MTSSAKRRWLAPAAIIFVGFEFTMIGAPAAVDRIAKVLFFS